MQVHVTMVNNYTPTFIKSTEKERKQPEVEKHLWKLKPTSGGSTSGYYRVFLTFHSQMTALGKDGYVRTRKVLGTSFDVRFLKRSHTYGQIITGNI